MKLRSLIVDDEPLAHNVIKEYVRYLEYIEIVDQAYTSMNALRILKSTTVDLVFLDIQMPKLSGLEMLKILENPPLVVITSAYEEYALESYELNVCDYLLKPFSLKRFVKACEKVLEIYQRKETGIEEKSSHFFIKLDKRFIRLTHEDVIYLEAYGNYVKVWTSDECLLTPRTLSSFEIELPKSKFLRIHKSYIVNKEKIEYLDGNTVCMINRAEVSVSKNFKQDLMKFIGKK